MAKTISDEVLAAALVEHGTIRDAAKAAGVSERTLYERMKQEDFRNLYQNARTDVLRSAVLNLTRRLQEAIETVSEIMTDKEISPATRLQAAQTILNHAGKLQDRLQEADDRAFSAPDTLEWGIKTL